MRRWVAPPDGGRLVASLPTLIRDRFAVVSKAAGGRAWLVGGTVRDLILGRDGGDVDLAVETDAAALARRVPAAIVKNTIFGTVTVAWPDGAQWDLVTARRESYREPAALPEVEPADLAADLRRRDFGINALALSITGELVDVTGGLADLAVRRVRALHPRSFIDDPTRLFRATRYAARLGFSIEPETARWMEQAVAAGLVDRLSPDRLRHELERTLDEDDFAAQATALSPLLVTIDPALGHSPRRIEGVERLLAERPDLCAGAQRWLLRLISLLPKDEVCEAAGRLTARLCLDRRQREALEAFGDLIVRPLGDASRSVVVARLEGLPLEAVLSYAARKPGELERIAWFLEHGRHITPLLDGHALMAGGLAPGPLLGRILAELRAARLDGKVETVDDEWALARGLAARSR